MRSKTVMSCPVDAHLVKAVQPTASGSNLAVTELSLLCETSLALLICLIRLHLCSSWWWSVPISKGAKGVTISKAATLDDAGQPLFNLSGVLF